MNKRPFNDIKGKVCVITGGGGVLGTDFALGLADAGMKVALLDFKKENADAVAKKVNDLYPDSTISVFANVLEKDTLLAAEKEVNERLGKLDILINGAGGNSPTATTQLEFLSKDNLGELSKGFFGLDLEGFRKVFDLNFLGTVLPTMVFAEKMAGRGGVIINISSMNSYRPLTKIPAYSAAKAGINNLTEWLAVHFAKLNIRVNAIAPGFFLTDQNRFLLTEKETGELTARGHKIIAGTPMGRFGEPDELVGTLLYLVSDMSKFVTGVIIPVDGGFNSYSGV
jgi:NAD(P)-dependent dehydrogenase (short-subunit alcohol dehydrogenase family)